MFVQKSNAQRPFDPRHAGGANPSHVTPLKRASLKLHPSQPGSWPPREKRSAARSSSYLDNPDTRQNHPSKYTRIRCITSRFGNRTRGEGGQGPSSHPQKNPTHRTQNRFYPLWTHLFKQIKTKIKNDSAVLNKGLPRLHTQL